MFQLFQRPTCPLLRDSSDSKKEQICPYYAQPYRFCQFTDVQPDDSQRYCKLPQTTERIMIAIGFSSIIAPFHPKQEWTVEQKQVQE